MTDWNAEVIDALDAAVFSGDLLMTDQREILKLHLDRWRKAIRQTEEAMGDLPNVTD